MTVEEGAVLEMAIKLPSSWPLRVAEVECRRKVSRHDDVVLHCPLQGYSLCGLSDATAQVGISESRLRKWLLSISAFLRSRNGSLLDAIALWKANAEREFDGAEECLICYAVVHPQTGALPRLKCRTCGKFFHGACLWRWFRSAGKSTCPHCQSAW